MCLQRRRQRQSVEREPSPRIPAKSPRQTLFGETILSAAPVPAIRQDRFCCRGPGAHQRLDVDLLEDVALGMAAADFMQRP